MNVSPLAGLGQIFAPAKLEAAIGQHFVFRMVRIGGPEIPPDGALAIDIPSEALLGMGCKKIGSKLEPLGC